MASVVVSNLPRSAPGTAVHDLIGCGSVRGMPQSAIPGAAYPGGSVFAPRQEAEWRCCGGDARHGRRGRNEERGRPGGRPAVRGRRARPPELHRSEGSLTAGQTRMPGALSRWLLSLSREQRESDSPCRAKPVGRAEEAWRGGWAPSQRPEK
jgi:hypothetical protein